MIVRATGGLRETMIGAAWWLAAASPGCRRRSILPIPGYFVYLVEKTGAIGGAMPQYNKVFPTNDCSMCIIAPKLVECGRHPNIRILTLTTVIDISGRPAISRCASGNTPLCQPDQVHCLRPVQRPLSEKRRRSVQLVYCQTQGHLHQIPAGGAAQVPDRSQACIRLKQPANAASVPRSVRPGDQLSMTASGARDPGRRGDHGPRVPEL
jgi:hypothetical protein